ncbi:MAG: hypothetical protein N2V75_06445 [Methanophagales archaeon]|nr:hypothetical protein [Methanophagales archaeon]
MTKKDIIERAERAKAKKAAVLCHTQSILHFISAFLSFTLRQQG